MHPILKTTLLLLIIGNGALAAPDPGKEPPNVIIIVTDDQGYGDIAAHGNPYLSTPHLDRLHESSVRFTDFHVDPTCSPTRGAILTGKYAHRARVWHTVAGGNHLRASEVTMADAFAAEGYRTAAFGKWHLGANYPYRPMDRGFQEWLGQGDGGTGTTDDWFFNDRVNDHYLHNGEWVQRDGYSTDVFFDAAIDFTSAYEAPFFIYLATYMVHSPHAIPDKSWLKPYIDAGLPEDVAYFFAGVERIDWNIGRLRAALEESGKAENTILIFTTDNGGTMGTKIFNAGMRGSKGQVYDGGHRVPFFFHWPRGQLQIGHDVDDLSAHFDLFPTLAEICGLESADKIDFDGRSFKSQLYDTEKLLPERTLFVERQRALEPVPWENTVGMTRQWRLVNNTELYDIKKDPGQTNNLIEEHPKVVEKIRAAQHGYWARVTPGDRENPSPIVGHPKDPETFLHASDWNAPPVPWNHGVVASGPELMGRWDITVESDGIYRFEVRRWPREAEAPIPGVPEFTKTIDSWDSHGPKTDLIYYYPGPDRFKALPVESIRFRVGELERSQAVPPDADAIYFDLPLQKGNTSVEGQFLDAKGDVIAGTYYVYVARKPDSDLKRH